MAVAFRTSATAQVNAAPIAVTLASPAAVGDTAIMALSHGVTAVTWTTPPGWTQVGTTMSTTSQTTAVYRKVLATGDIGSAITCTASVAGKQAVAVAVWSGASGAIGGVQQASANSSSATRVSPALACTGTCIEVISSKGTDPGAWTVPTNFTGRASVNQTLTGSVSLAIASSGTDLDGSDTWTLPIVSTQYQAMTLWLTPATGTNIPPTAVAGGNQASVVTYRTGVVNQANAASVSATIPVTAKPGYFAAAVHSVGIAGVTSSAPAGWTQQGSVVATSSQCTALFTKVLAAEDIGTPLTFAAVGGAGKQAVSITVWSGVDQLNPLGGIAVASDSTTTTTRSSPTITGTGRLIEVMVSKGTDPGAWTAPAAFTMRQHVEQTSTGSVTMAIASSDTALTGPHTWTLPVSTGQFTSWGFWMRTAAAAPAGSVEPYEKPLTIDGTGSSDPDGTIASLAWAQSGGTPSVTLGGSGGVRTFTPPGTLAGTTLTFTLTATDNLGATGTDSVSIPVLYATERVVVAGVETPAQLLLAGP